MASPRIRSLKHTFFSDEKICEYPLAVRWTFAGLIAHADDEGRLKGDPRLIKAQVWPLDDDITPPRVADHLTQLASGPGARIRWYKVDGRQYIELINFKRHQYIQKPKPSELPGPLPYDNDTVSVPDSYRLDGMGWDGNGKDGMGDSPDANRTGTEPRPLANASTETKEPDVGVEGYEPDHRFRQDDFKVRVKLPAEATKFVDELYGLATVRRREDVRRQLFDAIDPTKRGAFLRRGVYVKARDADHLARVCTAVRLDPPQQLDSAIVYVLRKLQDAETDANGRTVTEAASFDQKQTDALLTRYEAAAKAAANAWVKANRDAYAAITARLGVQFPGATTDASADSWIRIAYDAAHLSEVRKASGFPDFETWRANLPNIAKVG